MLSVRNLDLIGLILLAPGLLVVDYGLTNERPGIEQIGYVWLFATCGLFLVRLLSDPMMVRRPLLEPNLSVGGMTFLGISLLVFLMANVVNSEMTPDDLAGAKGAEQVRARQSSAPDDKSLETHGPGYPLLHLLPSLSTQMLMIEDTARQTPQSRDLRRDRLRIATARTMAILSHLAVVVGMVLIGYRHFDNIRAGIAAATLYLLLPYTAQFTGRVDHVLPAALLVWAVAAYRRPAGGGHADRPGDRGDLLPGVPVAAVAGLLLAARAAAVFAGRGASRWRCWSGRWSSRPTARPRSGRKCSRCSAGPACRPQDLQGFWGYDIIDPVYPLPGAGGAGWRSASAWPCGRRKRTWAR